MTAPPSLTTRWRWQESFAFGVQSHDSPQRFALHHRERPNVIASLLTEDPVPSRRPLWADAGGDAPRAGVAHKLARSRHLYNARIGEASTSEHDAEHGARGAPLPLSYKSPSSA